MGWKIVKNAGNHLSIENMQLNHRPIIHFSIAFLIILLLSSSVFLKEKEFLNIWLNKNHNLILDIFFKNITLLGSGWFLIPLFLFTLFRSYFLSLVLIVATILESIIVQLVLKNGIYSDVIRPIAYIPESELLHKVDGVIIHSLNSFPSGHTQTAFLIFTFLVFFCKRNYAAYFFLFLAVLIGLSRVYLLQHFFVDIWFGALIGYSVLLFVYLVFSKLIKPESKLAHSHLTLNLKRKSTEK